MRSFIFLLFIANINAFAQNQEIEEAHCTYTITKEGREPYVLNGMVRSLTGRDYLTLEPATVSDAKVTARILLTDNYYPVTLHPRGNTAKYLAFGNLFKDNQVELEYSEDDRTYHLICNLKR